MTLEEEIVARLDALVEGMNEVQADVKRLLEARTTPPEANPGAAEVLTPCEWPGCSERVSGQQAGLSREWCSKALCVNHEAHLRVVRANKKQATAP